VSIWVIRFWFLDVAAEKTQKAITEALIEGVGGFDTNKLKHTETQEKNPLPDKTGQYLLLWILINKSTNCIPKYTI